MAEDMKTRMNWVDNAIAFFNPKAGLSRINSRRSYEAAGHGRRNKSMRGASSTGPNLEISQSFVTLRNRSRHFVRNNGWAKRAIVSITNNTIGQGIRPAPVGSKPQVKKIKEIWHRWAETTSCDFYGKNTFYGLQRTIMGEIAEAGDCLIVKRKVAPTAKNPIPIKLQILEGDQLDQSKDFVNEQGYARLGVQHNNDGIIIGYWIFSNHPNDMTGYARSISSELISADDIIHPFEILRIGQVRGIPMGVSSFMKMSDFSDYEDAQLVRQKAAASFCAFISGAVEGTNTVEMLEPGLVEYLKEGETITFSNPPAADGYSEYSKKILQGIAASYGITYEMLTMDYSNVNFSSGRMAKIDISGNFRNWQYNMIVPQVCVPVWEWFMEAVQIVGLLKNPLECNAMDWTAPRVQQLDPTKETNARIAAISGGLQTLSECIREDGRDPEEFFEEYKADMERMKTLGITIKSILAPEPIPQINGEQ